MTLTRAPGLAWVGSEERVALVRLDAPTDDPVILADSAAVVWLALDDPAPDLAELVARVAAAYDVPGETIRVDVEGFVTRLLEAGLAVSAG